MGRADIDIFLLLPLLFSLPMSILPLDRVIKLWSKHGLVLRRSHDIWLVVLLGEDMVRVMTQKGKGAGGWISLSDKTG